MDDVPLFSIIDSTGARIDLPFYKADLRCGPLHLSKIIALMHSRGAAPVDLQAFNNSVAELVGDRAGAELH